jgi:pyruvate/2-oxoglutarate dehydrogenase complex dihydrolipoamide acyltransferase (E2) component
MAAPAERRLEMREYLALTLSIDHDVVAGASAARFIARLRGLIEGCTAISETRP